jgi:hypothetical protein
MQPTFWLAILLIGVTAGAAAAVGEWRTYRRFGDSGYLWGACSSMAITLILASYLMR